MVVALVKFGLDLPLTDSFNDLKNLYYSAGAVGFDYAFMPDHLRSIDGKLPMNVWDALCMLTTVPSDVGLGSMVADIHRADASTTIQHIHTLVNHAEERDVIIGLGSGMMYDNEGVGNNRSYTLHKILHVKSSKDVAGARFVLAAKGKNMKRFARDFADGWMAKHAITFDDYCKEKKDFGYISSDRNFIFAVDVSVAFEESDEVFNKLAHKYLLQTDKYFYSMLTEENLGELEKDVKNVDRDVLRKIAIIGDEVAVEKRLQEFVNVGVTLFTVKLYGDEFGRFRRVMECLRQKN